MQLFYAFNTQIQVEDPHDLFIDTCEEETLNCETFVDAIVEYFEGRKTKCEFGSIFGDKTEEEVRKFVRSSIMNPEGDTGNNKRLVYKAKIVHLLGGFLSAWRIIGSEDGWGYYVIPLVNFSVGEVLLRRKHVLDHRNDVWMS